MSINVTVTGNPVSIKRGKMITTDSETEKKEFAKRRLLRLEQVRQQSKQLAETVRNRVRKERNKQLGLLEQEGKEKLKNWQTRKLLDLHNQYLDALDEIGGAHKEAESLTDESEHLNTQKLENEKIAKTRGRHAQHKLQVQRNEENYKKAMPIQHKKLVRDIENRRSSLVSAVRYKKPRHKEKPIKAKKVKKARAKTDINVTVSNGSEDSETSASSSSSRRLSTIQEESSNGSGDLCECSDSPRKEKHSPQKEKHPSEPIKKKINKNISTKFKEQTQEQIVQQEDPQLRKEQEIPTISSIERFDLEQKAYQKKYEENRKFLDSLNNEPMEVPMDTRISDRIKRRNLMLDQAEYCGVIVEPTPAAKVIESTKIREKIFSRYSPGYKPMAKDPLDLSSDECICIKTEGFCSCKEKVAGESKSAAVQTEYQGICACGCNKHIKSRYKSTIKNPISKPQTSSIRPTRPSEYIPTMPAVKLRDLGSPKKQGPSSASTLQGKTSLSSGPSRVQHYDHMNRFSRDVPSWSRAERIPAHSIEVLPQVSPETEKKYEKIKQKDKEAQVRGKLALEKEKIHREYQDIIKQLPLLQRKENVSQIGADKPEYHMSDDRLKELEKERQNKLENAFSKAVPNLKPRIITLPSKEHLPKTNQLFNIIDENEPKTTRGQWNAAKPKITYSLEEVHEIIKAFTSHSPESRKEKLKQLLRSLKIQREELIREIKALPRDDSTDALIGDLSSFSDLDELKSERENKKIAKDKQDQEIQVTETDILKKFKKQDKKQRAYQNGYSKSPRVLVLQNMSTQTTPRVGTNGLPSSTTTRSSSGQGELFSEELTKNVDTLPSGKKICTKAHIPCNCYKGEGDSSDEICKILIKLDDEKIPKVEVISKNRKNYSEGLVVKPCEKESRLATKSKEKSLQSPKKDKQKETRLVKTKSVATETDHSSKIAKPSKKAEKSTWKDYLHRLSLATASSTSYMSPPTISTTTTTTTSTEAKSISLTDSSSDDMDLDLLLYIVKALEMSRGSIDNLGVSSSDIATPSESVIGIDSNNPIADVEKICKVIESHCAKSEKKIHSSDKIKGFLTSSETSIHSPRQEKKMHSSDKEKRYFSLSDSSIDSAKQEKEMHSSDKENGLLTTSDSSIQKKKEKKMQNADKKKRFLTPPISSSSSYDRDKKLQTATEVSKPYGDDKTDSCTKRIANLEKMIEQLRKEKMKLLSQSPITSTDTCDDICSTSSSTSTVKDYTTNYYDFPPFKTGSSSSISSIDEEELNRRLLDIDMGLAEKLKKLREIETEFNCDRHSYKVAGKETNPKLEAGNDYDTDSETLSEPVKTESSNHEFAERLKMLVQENEETKQLIDSLENDKTNKEEVETYVPLLVDIPKLPILELEPKINHEHESNHPPLSKGMLNALKFNNITLMPHVLSTIIEADSQLSTKISSSNSKTNTLLNKSRPSCSSEESSQTSDSHLLRSNSNELKFVEISDSSKSTCTESTCTTLTSSGSSKKTSSSLNNDVKEVADMLTSIGMHWAVPTLQRTQEALAMSSSSNSGHSDTKDKMSITESDGQLTDSLLKKCLKRKNLSHSLTQSSETPASFDNEYSQISGIQSSSSAENTNQRTSTPLVSSKNSSKSKESQPYFTESELSSVRSSSCEEKSSRQLSKEK